MDASQESLDKYTSLIFSEIAQLKAMVNVLMDFQKDLAVHAGLDREFVDSLPQKKVDAYAAEYSAQIQARLES
jgi:hypothetical protein